MIHVSTAIHRKQADYEVKSVVSIEKIYDSKQEIANKLKELRSKLEHTVPGSYKATYNLAQDELVVCIRTERTIKAEYFTQLNDFIKRAAMALKLK